MPKPFITLPGTGTSLLNDTYARLNAMPTPPAAVVTIAAKEHFNLCQDCHTRAFPQSEHFFIGEPLKRNTAPAIAAAEFVRRNGDSGCCVAFYGSPIKKCSLWGKARQS